MLANMLRTDRHAHRPLPKDSELVRAVAVLARAGQDATWQRQQAANQLRSLLREYFPAALAAFHVKHVGLASPEARTILAAAPPRRGRAAHQDPAALAAHQGRAHAATSTAGSSGCTASSAPRRCATPADVEDAYGHAALAVLTRLDAAVTAAEAAAGRPPQPLSTAPARRDHHQLPRPRTADRRAGPRRARRRPRPLRRRTGTQGLRRRRARHPRLAARARLVLHRRVKNHRLAAAGYNWAFAALTHSPGARQHYDRRRSAGDGHAAALRNLFNRFLGWLYHCLHDRPALQRGTSLRRPSRQPSRPQTARTPPLDFISARVSRPRTPGSPSATTVACSSMNLTSVVWAVELRREESRSRLQDRVRPPQLTVLLLQPNQPGHDHRTKCPAGRQRRSGPA